MPSCFLAATVERSASDRAVPMLLRARSDPGPQDGDTRDLAGAVADVLDHLGDAVVLADGSARVIHMNRNAEGLLARRILTVRGGQICVASSRDSQRLHALVAAALRTRDGSGHMRTETRLFVTVAALGGPEGRLADPAVAMILLRDIEAASLPSQQSLIAYFGLTPAEARLAQEITRGDGLARCARRLGTRITTVRSHLKHIFEKTETRRQAHLVRLLLSCGAPLAPPPATPTRPTGDRARARPQAGC